MADVKISDLTDGGTTQDGDLFEVERPGTPNTSRKVVLGSYVPTSRTVSAGTGLTGGGDLSADRSLDVAYGTTAGTAAQGNDSRITGAAQKASNLSDLANAATAFDNIKQAASTSSAGVVEKATDAEVYAATADKYLAADHIESAASEVTITDGSSPSFDWDAGVNFLWTLGANRTCPNPTNGQPGTYRSIRVIGNSGTERTLSFGTQYEGDLPSLSDITSTKQYLLQIRCISATHFVVIALNCTVS